jgi:hypothetical protein
MRHVLKPGSRMQLTLVIAFSLLGASFADSVAAGGPHVATGVAHRCGARAGEGNPEPHTVLRVGESGAVRV